MYRLTFFLRHVFHISVKVNLFHIILEALPLKVSMEEVFSETYLSDVSFASNCCIKNDIFAIMTYGQGYTLRIRISTPNWRKLKFYVPKNFL